MTYSPHVYTALAFAGLGLCGLSAPAATKAGTRLLLLWISVGCLNGALNVILPEVDVWCDISTRITLAVSVGIPAALICISRELHNATSQAFVAPSIINTPLLVNLMLGLGLPGLQLILQIIPQTHRYEIHGGFGCSAALSNTWPAYVLVYSWPALIGLCAAGYSILNVLAVSKRRRAITELLASQQALVQYLCTLALSVILVILTIALAVSSTLAHSQVGVDKWAGWAVVHQNLSSVLRSPNPTGGSRVALEISRWNPVACAVVSFLCVGVPEFSKLVRRVPTHVPHMIYFPASRSPSPYAPPTKDLTSLLPIFDIARSRSNSHSSCKYTDDGRRTSLVVFAVDPVPMKALSHSRRTSFSSLESATTIRRPEPAVATHTNFVRGYWEYLP